jgi:hypothetical protein
MSEAPYFFYGGGHFPFCVPEMTTAEIDALIHPDGPLFPYVGTVRGKTLQEVWRMYWLLDTIKITGEFYPPSEGEPPPLPFALDFKLPPPASRVCGGNTIRNYDPFEDYPLAHVYVEFAFGAESRADPDDPFAGTVAVPPVVYESDTGKYMLTYSLLYIGGYSDSHYVTVGISDWVGGSSVTLGTLFGQPNHVHSLYYGGPALLTFGDETYYDPPTT